MSVQAWLMVEDIERGKRWVKPVEGSSLEELRVIKNYEVAMINDKAHYRVRLLLELYPDKVEAVGRVDNLTGKITWHSPEHDGVGSEPSFEET